jgi:hypothetical protein
MPVLAYDPLVTDQPAVDVPQQCDQCGAVALGMFFSYPGEGEVGVLCQKCELDMPCHADSILKKTNALIVRPL